MNKLFMMIGLPASGKSSLAEQIAKSEDAEIVSSDNIRKELYGDENIQGDNNKVFRILQERIINGLKNNRNMIYDATNISYKTRMAFLQRLNKLEVEKIAVMVATPYEDCLIRNSQRERKVPEEVIKNMYFNFYIPQYYEGFDDIQIKYNSNYIFSFDSLTDMEQDNPHHSLSVKRHCFKVFELLCGNDIYLQHAGLLHDIGKLKTKTFTNMKGEVTDIAHYYNHEKVSAYDSLFNEGIVRKVWEQENKDALKVLNLIQWHMILHFDLLEKTITKYKNMLGENTWRDLEILHKADC